MQLTCLGDFQNFSSGPVAKLELGKVIGRALSSVQSADYSASLGRYFHEERRALDSFDSSRHSLANLQLPGDRLLRCLLLHNEAALFIGVQFDRLADLVLLEDVESVVTVEQPRHYVHSDVAVAVKGANQVLPFLVQLHDALKVVRALDLVLEFGDVGQLLGEVHDLLLIVDV